MEPNAIKKRGKRLNFKNSIESNKNEYSENGRRKEVEITESDYMVTSSDGPQMVWVPLLCNQISNGGMNNGMIPTLPLNIEAMDGNDKSAGIMWDSVKNAHGNENGRGRRH